MTKGFYTCIIVPEASSRLHKLRIPRTALRALAVLALFTFIVFVAFGFNYARMALKASEYDQIQAENTQLKIKSQDLQVSTSKLDSKISELETLSEKIRNVIENDPAFGPSHKLNLTAEGGSRENLTTAQLIQSGRMTTNVDLLQDRATGLEGQYNLLDQLVSRRVVMDPMMPNIWPIHGRIGSPFGRRIDPFESGSEMHLGLDIDAPFGTAVNAPANGIVRIAQWETDYGNLIVIDHGNGLSTRFAHLKAFAVRPGQKISKTQVIGWVGMTGRTTGPHLHYEVRVNDRPVNPRSYLPKGD